MELSTSLVLQPLHKEWPRKEVNEVKAYPRKGRKNWGKKNWGMAFPWAWGMGPNMAWGSRIMGVAVDSAAGLGLRLPWGAPGSATAGLWSCPTSSAFWPEFPYLYNWGNNTITSLLYRVTERMKSFLVLFSTLGFHETVSFRLYIVSHKVTVKRSLYDRVYFISF